MAKRITVNLLTLDGFGRLNSMETLCTSMGSARVRYRQALHRTDLVMAAIEADGEQVCSKPGPRIDVLAKEDR